jgi:hypothetical protein
MSKYTVNRGYGKTIIILDNGDIIGNVITEHPDAIIEMLAHANAADKMTKPQFLSSDDPLNTEAQNQ